MIITNNYELPESYVKACMIGDEFHEVKPDTYHVTELLQPLRMIVLTRRHQHELIQDASDMFNVVLGKAFHSLMEKVEKKDKNFKVEVKLSARFKGVKIVGRLDRMKADGSEIYDYKTCSRVKIGAKDFSDWKLQGLLYAWLLHKKGLTCKKVNFIAFMKDWRKARPIEQNTIPPVYVYSFNVTEDDIKYIENWLEIKINALKKLKNVADDKLPICSDEEKWKGLTTWAIINPDTGKAYKVVNTRAEAELRLEQLNRKGYYIEERTGESKRCLNYCLVCPFCKNREVNNG